MTIVKNDFIPAGPKVTRVGLGGEGILRTWDREAEAQAVILEALNQGILYYDCAAAYSGSQGYYGSVWGTAPDRRALVFQASKSAQRDGVHALRDLDNTLKEMKIDYLDLWQIHDLRTPEEFSVISGPGGALEAFIRSRNQGKVRHIGVTGHSDPDLLTRAVLEWPVDSVLLPVNPVEACLGGFMDRTLPAANQKGVAVIAMKVLGAGRYLAPDAGVTAETLIRFALAQPVTTVIVGCRSPEEVQTLARVGGETETMPVEEQERLLELYRPHARKLAFYRGWV